MPSNECLVNTGEEWLLNVLENSTERVRDMVLILIWRVWNLPTNLLHGNDQVPVKILVKLLNSYLNSLWHAKKYNTEEMIKGKMVERVGWSEPKNKETASARPGSALLLRDGFPFRLTVCSPQAGPRVQGWSSGIRMEA